MPSVSESGHAKNVANFNLLLQHLAEMELRYNPAPADLQLDHLRQVYIAAQAALTRLFNAKSGYDKVVNDRSSRFKELATLTTRINATLKANRLPEKTLDDAAGFIARIRGYRRTAPRRQADAAADEATVPHKRISASHQSFDQQLESFSQLMALINNEPGYRTNDPALTPQRLNEFAQQLAAANNEVAIAATVLREARLARDKALYDPEKGLIVLVKGIKNYLKSLPAASLNPDYREIVRLRFVQSAIHVRIDN